MSKAETPDLVLALPPGWVEHPNPNGSLEYRPREDGSRGCLKASKLADEYFAFISEQEDLASLAEEMGTRLHTQGQNWGDAAGSMQGTCAMGRVGFAVFREGAFPAMFLWLTVSDEAALLWTWFGPDSPAEEVEQAVRIVLSARLRPEPR